MLFNSYDFLVFFPIVVAVYVIIPKKIRYIWLLLASYYFYMGWNAKYAWLLAISTGVTWISSLVLTKIEKGDYEKKELYKKLTAGSCFVINLGILGFFKYFDFVVNNINSIISRFGFSIIDKKYDILLPVGISFYIFQALSYTVDVYRGEIEAERNPFRYALFVSFFPQLVAGPIERSKNLLNQLKNIENIKLIDVERIFGGIILMLWGYFMKMMIADRASVIVNSVYNSYWSYGSIELIVASVLFAIQIYCDFAGYSLIAIGAAKVMGFELMENFNTPYFATSIKDFWRRWHISLSTWFRDYLYIPLGGNRCTKLRQYFNLMVTFLVSGLWHGADWHFVVWGGLHGAYQIAEDSFKPISDKFVISKNKKHTFSYKFGQVVRTFVLADIAWIFFRADSFIDGLSIIKGIITKWNPWALFDKSLYGLGLDEKEVQILIVAILILIIVDISRYITGKSLEKVLMDQCVWFRWIVFFGLFYMVIMFGRYGAEFEAASFIYFQF